MFPMSSSSIEISSSIQTSSNFKKLTKTSKPIDCTDDYSSIFKPIASIAKGVYRLFGITYIHPPIACKSDENKTKRDAIFYTLVVLTFLFLIVLVGLVAFLIKKYYLSKNIRSPSNGVNDAGVIAAAQYTPFSPQIQAPLIPQDGTGMNNEQGVANAEVIQKIGAIHERTAKRRLEIQEFQRRLLMYQIAKRQKQEETATEKIGNFLRSGVNFLFGDPYTGLDFTDPEAMFYPYFRNRQDHSLLTAYGAIREHMMQDINQMSALIPNRAQFHNPNNMYQLDNNNNNFVNHDFIKQVFGERS